MSVVRFTYKNALHHVYGRGIDRIPIFNDDNMKCLFIDLLREHSRKDGIEVYSFCIMTNHYHITLRNNTLKMSDMMRDINSSFAIAYNSISDRKGYVWENRFGSVPIEDSKHLITAIAYTLMNSVRAGIVNNLYEYPWSSIHELFSDSIDKSKFITKYRFIEQLFGSEKNMQKCMRELGYKKPQYSRDRYLTVIGSSGFLDEVVKNMNRRKPERSDESRMKRREDSPTEKRTLEEVIKSIEKQFDIRINKLDYRIARNKKIRYLLLISIRENTLCSYKTIHRLKPFKHLKYKSLSALYSHALKLRKQGKI